MELREQLALLGYVQRIAVALEVIADKLPPRGSLEFETPGGELGVALRGITVPAELHEEYIRLRDAVVSSTTSFDPALVQVRGPTNLGENLGVVS